MAKKNTTKKPRTVDAGDAVEAIPADPTTLPTAADPTEAAARIDAKRARLIPSTTDDAPWREAAPWLVLDALAEELIEWTNRRKNRRIFDVRAMAEDAAKRIAEAVTAGSEALRWVDERPDLARDLRGVFVPLRDRLHHLEQLARTSGNKPGAFATETADVIAGVESFGSHLRAMAAEVKPAQQAQPHQKLARAESRRLTAATLALTESIERQAANERPADRETSPPAPAAPPNSTPVPKSPRKSANELAVHAAAAELLEEDAEHWNSAKRSAQAAMVIERLKRGRNDDEAPAWTGDAPTLSTIEKYIRNWFNAPSEDNATPRSAVSVRDHDRRLAVEK